MLLLITDHWILDTDSQAEETMKKRTKNLILIVVGVQILLIVGLLVLPGAVGAIPGR